MNRELDELVSDIEETYSLEDSYPLCMDYMITCLELIREQIPWPVSDCLETARDFWAGKASGCELDRCRVRARKFLHRLERQEQVQTEAGYAVRALVCVLYPVPGTADIHELFYWFLSHLGLVADVDKSLVAITKRYFPRIQELHP